MAVEDVKMTLPELLDSLAPGDEVILTKNRQPVAKLVSEPAKPVVKSRPGPGLGKGMITFIAPDFDAPMVLEGVHGVILLLDSHSLLSLMDGNSQLSATAASVIADGDNRL